MSKKIFIKTFGCQMNEYDSNRILDVVKKIDLSDVINSNGGVNKNKLSNPACIFKMKVHTKNPIRIFLNAFAISTVTS